MQSRWLAWVSIFVPFLVLISALSVKAESLNSNDFYVFQSPSSSSTLIEYVSEGGWVIETYSEPRDELPTKTGRWYFGEKKDADEFIRSLSVAWILQPAAFQNEEPKFKTELMSQTLWDTKAEWDWSWEIKYAAWVRANINAKFFFDRNIATDCADVAVASRWIFARINGLPAAQSIGSGRTLFTNESFKSEWVKLKRDTNWEKDMLFRKALDYVLNYSYTHSLLKDSYPIAINTTAFLEGTHHLVTHTESGHTQFMVEVNTSNNNKLPLYAVASTIPRHVRLLMAYPFFDSEQPEIRKGGFLKLRWAQKINGVWSLLPAAQMPNFSNEQYDPKFMTGTTNFSLAVFKRLNPTFDPVLRVKESEKSLTQLVSDRVALVQNGYDFCESRDCRPGTANYENWSTPSRDKRIGTFIADLSTYVKEISVYYPNAATEWENFQTQKILTLGKYDYLVSSLMLVWDLKFYESDPRAPVESRWTLAPQVFAGKIASQMRAQLSSREQKIQDNRCLGDSSCTVTSAAYLAAQTFDIDTQINALSTSVHAYCPSNLPANCNDFFAAIRTVKVTIGKNVVDLADTPEFTVWLNSDPRVPNDQRRGSYALTHPTRIFDTNIGEIIEATNGDVFVSSDLKFQLFDANLNLLWEMPKLDDRGAFNQETSEYVYFSQNTLTVKDRLARTASYSFKTIETPTFRWTSAQVFIAVDTAGTVPKLSLYRLSSTASGPSLSLIDSITGYDSEFSDGYIDGRTEPLLTYRSRDANNVPQISYYNLVTGLKSTLPPLPVSLARASVTALVEKNGRTLIKFQQPNSSTQIAWVTLGSGALDILPLPAADSLRFITDDSFMLQLAAPAAEVQFVTLKEDGSVESLAVIADSIGYGSTRNGYFSAQQDSRDMAFYFNSATRKLSRFALPADRFLFSSSAPYVLVIGNTSSLEVYELETSKLVFAAGQLYAAYSSPVSVPFAMKLVRSGSPWVQYLQADGSTDLPLLTTSLRAGAWMNSTDEEHFGRFKSFLGANGTSVLFRAL